MDFDVKKYTYAQLIEIYDTVNHWNWHELLGEKPKCYDDMLDFHMNENYTLPTKSKILRPIIKGIKEVVKEKDLLKYHHINNLNSTEIEFTKWWYKRKIQKMLGIGFYSKKMRNKIKEVLTIVAEKHSEYMNRDRF